MHVSELSVDPFLKTQPNPNNQGICLSKHSPPNSPVLKLVSSQVKTNPT